MSDIITMSISLPAKYADALDKLAEEKGMSKSAVVRQSIALYQFVDAKANEGKPLRFGDELALIIY